MTTLEPVAWMYHHSDLGEFEFIKTETLRNRCRAMGAFPESSGWIETPLVPLATAQALEARVAELEEQNAALIAEMTIPADIAEQVLEMGEAEWGATAEHTSEGHLHHLEESLRITREQFNLEDVPVAMHGLYLKGTETVLCHTGTSPNSGQNARALTGAWNWLLARAALKGSSHEG